MLLSKGEMDRRVMRVNSVWMDGRHGCGWIGVGDGRSGWVEWVGLARSVVCRWDCMGEVGLMEGMGVVELMEELVVTELMEGMLMEGMGVIELMGGMGVLELMEWMGVVELMEGMDVSWRMTVGV